MKKTVRIIALISIICMIMSMLSGCLFIDDLRESKIVADKNGNLRYKNKVYIMLGDNQGDLYFDYNYSTENTLYLMKEEEPVLYGYFNDEYCELSRDEILIQDFEGNLYCRKDKYDSVIDRIENGFTPEAYMYTYEKYNDTSLFDYSWEQKERYLNDSDLEMINDIMTNVTPITNGSYMLDNSDYYVEIYGCSKDLLFRESVYSIFYLDNKYLIHKSLFVHN